jgi:hypothetical protein
MVKTEKYHLELCQTFCIFFSAGPNVAFLQRKGRASELYIFILQNFWANDSLKVLFRIPSTRKNVVSFG